MAAISTIAEIKSHYIFYIKNPLTEIASGINALYFLPSDLSIMSLISASMLAWAATSA